MATIGLGWAMQPYESTFRRVWDDLDTKPTRNHQTNHGSYRCQVEAARQAISRSCKGRNKRKGKR